jgi:recombination protein RecT
MSTQLAKTKDKYTNVKALLLSRREEISAALPSHVTVDRMIQVALGAIQKTPALLDCTQISLFSCIMQASRLGLEVDGMLGHAYLIPRKIKGVDTCTLMMGFQGMLDLARRSGKVSTISARVVREGDEFRYQYGLHEDLVHIPKARPDAEITHAYCVCKFTDGGFAFEVLTRADLDYTAAQVMEKDRSGTSIWRSDFASMSRKTAIRRLFKYLPKSAELARAVAIDGAQEYGGMDLSTTEIVTADGEVLNAIPDASVVDTDSLAAQYQSDADDGVR